METEDCLSEIIKNSRIERAKWLVLDGLRGQKYIVCKLWIDGYYPKDIISQTGLSKHAVFKILHDCIVGDDVPA